MTNFDKLFETMISPKDVGASMKDHPDVIKGMWDETETELIVNIHDVEDRISTVDRNGTPRPGNKIRIRAQMERLLRKMGYDVEASGKRGKYQVRIMFPDATGKDIGEFKLVPQKDPILR
jgi:hypothetical protein